MMLSTTNELWNSLKEKDWRYALDRYWTFVKPTHLATEKEFMEINPQKIERMNARQWYEFLLTKYFFWKYTAQTGIKQPLHNLWGISARMTVLMAYSKSKKIFLD